MYSGPLIVGQKLILSHEPVDVPWAFNIHGHEHNKSNPLYLRHYDIVSHYDIASNVIGYKAVNLNTIIKAGLLSEIDSIHRITINNATKHPINKNEKS